MYVYLYSYPKEAALGSRCMQYNILSAHLEGISCCAARLGIFWFWRFFGSYLGIGETALGPQSTVTTVSVCQ
jgi:hypothetical protein